MTFYNLPETEVKVDYAAKADPQDKKARKLVIGPLPEDFHAQTDEDGRLTFTWRER